MEKRGIGRKGGGNQNGPCQFLPEFLIDNIKISDRIHLPLNMGDLRIFKGSTQMEHSITSLQVTSIRNFDHL